MPKGKLHIDGTVKGSVRSEGDVTIGRSGRVEGDVVAARIVVSGTLVGNVHCDSIEVVASGAVVGDVLSREFVVEKGARFEGENHLPPEGRDDTAPVLKPVPAGEGSAKPVSERIEKLDDKPTQRGESTQFRR